MIIRLKVNANGRTQSVASGETVTFEDRACFWTERECSKIVKDIESFDCE